MTSLVCCLGLCIISISVSGVIDNVFTDEFEAFGAIETVELKPNGQNIPVTEANKQEYVKLIVRHRLLQGIADQVPQRRRPRSDCADHGAVQGLP
jgi:hypothetical protein